MSKYRVYYCEPFGDEYGTLLKTDDPLEAIQAFFVSQKDHPSCIAIEALTYSDADDLIKYAYHERDKVEEVYRMSTRPVYRLDYIQDEICKGFNKYSMEDKSKIYRDQVHPFSLG